MLENNMNLATNLFIVYIVYTVMTYTKILFNKKARSKHQLSRQRLAELRKIPVKTQEEQREFIKLKYPPSDGFKWTFKNVARVFVKLLIMFTVFMTLRHLWSVHIDWYFAIWQVIIIMVVFPILLNKLLKKYNLHQDDILVFFK